MIGFFVEDEYRQLHIEHTFPGEDTSADLLDQKAHDFRLVFQALLVDEYEVSLLFINDEISLKGVVVLGIPAYDIH